MSSWFQSDFSPSQQGRPGDWSSFTGVCRSGRKQKEFNQNQVGFNSDRLLSAVLYVLKAPTSWGLSTENTNRENISESNPNTWKHYQFNL